MEGNASILKHRHAVNADPAVFLVFPNFLALEALWLKQKPISLDGICENLSEDHFEPLNGIFARAEQIEVER